MLLVAPDSFKGTLSAAEVAGALARGARAGSHDVSVELLPLADGGEGTAEAIRRAVGGSRIAVPTTDPWGVPITGDYLRVDHSLEGMPGPVAVVEWATAGGFVEARTPADALRADSGGVGQVIRAALDAGCASVVIGLGGSATTDGASGLLRELGARLIDRDGRPVPPGPSGLARLAAVDITDLRRFPCVALTDVTAPLHGPKGTVARFASQKGADGDARDTLDAMLRVWSDRVDPGAVSTELAGAGAAGGAGFGLTAALRARLLPGATAMADLCNLDARLAHATRVWTGEGRLDGTTASGKVPSEVLRRSRVPVDLVGGDLGPGAAELDRLGPATVVTLVDPPAAPPPRAWLSLGVPLPRERALADPAGALERVGRELVRHHLAAGTGYRA